MMDNMMLSIFTMCLFVLSMTQTPTPQKEEKPIPIGQVNDQEIFHFNPEYKTAVEEYKPNEEAVDFLKHYSHDIVVEVFYGGWCGDSRAHVPSFMKVMEAAHNAHIMTSYVAVDRKKQEPLGLTQDRRIERVPTFIIYADGRDIGRIIETPEKSVEEHLMKILKSK
jgi:thiol-disulfide isomerase/thioredoxin